MPTWELSSLSSLAWSFDALGIGLLVVAVGCQFWCLRLTRVSLAALPALEERVGRLTRSVALLVDTTEGCFEAVSAQLVRNDDTVTPRRQPRQRRIAGAVKRGRTVSQIAAQEDMAEGEAALRVRLAQDLQAR